MSGALLLAHAAATWFMVGLIWFVQVVHYPLFAGVGEHGWPAYGRRHQVLTTLVVGPAMLVEVATCILLLILMPGVLPAAGALLLGLVWASTFFVQVPLHRRLERGLDAALVQKLVATNWVRTALWSARGVVALILLSPS
ncbi:MAG: hypothetical protein KIT54_03030 [Phycisphaeraceae bacterium]|nr:hypothetical protein [Phycisphaeraceae bacterium]